MEVLFGDEPALEPHERFYQRVPAGNAVEAIKVAEQSAKDMRLLQCYDDIAITVLSMVAKTRPAAGKVTVFLAESTDRMRRFRAYSRSMVYQIGECKSLETRKIAHAVCRRFDDAKRNHEASVIARRPGTCPVLLILDV
jgi:hypothetical protein